MASLVDQIFQQAQLGTAPDPNANPFAVGMQLGQGQQRINIEKQRLAMEIGQAQLSKTLMQQDLELKQHQLTNLLENRQATVENEAAFQSLSSLVAQQMRVNKPVEAAAAYWEAVGKNRGLWRHKGMEPLLEDIQKGVTSDIALQQMRNLARAAGGSFTPGFGTATNPITGERSAFFQESPNQARLVPSDSTATKPLSPLGKLQYDRDAAIKAGDTAKVAEINQLIQKQAALEGRETIISPDGTVTLREGVQADKPSATQVAKAEQTIAGAVQAARLGSTLLNKLRPEDVGILGKGGEVVVDQGLAQLFPALANTKRVSGRTLLRFYRNDVTRALKLDSQMSDKEQARIEAMLPSDGTNESIPSALQKIKDASREIAERARFGAQRAGRELPKELLLPAELMALVKARKITPEEATEIAKNSPFADEYDAFTGK